MIDVRNLHLLIGAYPPAGPDFLPTPGMELWASGYHDGSHYNVYRFGSGDTARWFCFMKPDMGAGYACEMSKTSRVMKIMAHFSAGELSERAKDLCYSRPVGFRGSAVQPPVTPAAQAQGTLF